MYSKLTIAPMTKSLGKLIGDRLEELGHTQAWLAEEADVSENAVSKWIRTGKISRENLIKVAQILGLSLDKLGTEENKTSPALELVYVDGQELHIITAYRESTPMGKALIRAAAESAPRAASLDLISGRNKS